MCIEYYSRKHIFLHKYFDVVSVASSVQYRSVDK